MHCAGTARRWALRFPLGLLVLLPMGCVRLAEPPTTVPPAVHEEPQPVESAAPSRAEISYDTPHDGRFAQFVAKTAGPMVQKVAVGIERKGIMRIELGEATSPDDTLPLTKSVLAGARREFPDKPITLAIFDPKGEAILKAHYRPEQGVHYEVVKGDHADAPQVKGERQAKGERQEGSSSPSALSQSGTTARDRQFADWAMQTGHRYLRYIQADLDRHGRLWFGVTRTVEPNDVTALTESLLKGARKEFPDRTLTATAFDPDGERIGRATLGMDGTLHWAH